MPNPDRIGVALSRASSDEAKVHLHLATLGRLSTRVVEKIKPEKVLLGMVVVTGVLFRLAHYLANVSLSLDESFLALNLFSKSYWQLAGPLNFNQAAPVGFLELEKLALAVPADTSYLLRLLPFLASLLALLLFYRLSITTVDKRGRIIALVAFAASDPLIYYSATAKQYSLDVTVALAMYVLMSRPERLKTARTLASAALLGAVAVWLSHPSAFVLFAVVTVVIATSWAGKAWSMLASWCGVALVWMSSFTIAYAVSQSNLESIQTSLSGTNAFLPQAGDSSSFWEAITELQYLAGTEDTSSGESAIQLLLGGIAVNEVATLGLLGIALIGVVDRLRRLPAVAYVLVAPAVAAGVASLIGQYPLLGRTLVFLIPGLCLLIGQGFAALHELLRPRVKLLVPGLSVLLMVPILLLPVRHLVQPRVNEDMLSTLEVLDRQRKTGDALYVYFAAQYALSYYLQCECADLKLTEQWRLIPTRGGRQQWAQALSSTQPDLVVGRRDARREDRADESGLELLRDQKRVWILVAEIPSGAKQALLRRADRLGRQIAVYASGGPDGTRAELYLFDFGGKRRTVGDSSRSGTGSVRVIDADTQQRDTPMQAT